MSFIPMHVSAIYNALLKIIQDKAEKDFRVVADIMDCERIGMPDMYSISCRILVDPLADVFKTDERKDEIYTMANHMFQRGMTIRKEENCDLAGFQQFPFFFNCNGEQQQGVAVIDFSYIYATSIAIQFWNYINIPK